MVDDELSDFWVEVVLEIVVFLPEELIALLGDKITDTIIPTFANGPLPFAPLLLVPAIDTLANQSPPSIHGGEIPMLNGCTRRQRHEQRR